MRKRESQNSKIDAIGKRLIRKTMLTEIEIDNIVSTPMLYSSIRNGVNKTPVEQAKSAWFRAPAVAAFASLLVVVGLSAFVVLRQGESTQTGLTTPKQVVPVAVNKSSEPDGIVDEFEKPPVPEIETPLRREGPQIQDAGYRRPITRQQRKPVVPMPPDLEFIPLVYSGDPAESVRGGRVIRVELSRASLFAMGINIPLENGAETVKADLLVGQDGMPRGIRMPN